MGVDGTKGAKGFVYDDKAYGVADDDVLQLCIKYPLFYALSTLEMALRGASARSCAKASYYEGMQKMQSFTRRVTSPVG